MEQFALPLTSMSDYSDESFILSASNRLAWEWIKQWPDWPVHTTILYGPPACGKKHLAYIWLRQSGAMQSGAMQRGVCEEVDAALSVLRSGDIPSGSGIALLQKEGDVKDEEALLHLYNYSRESGVSLLILADCPPVQWGVKLPDLASRLQEAQIQSISAPDDVLLQTLIIKLFSDRQLRISADVPAYIVPRVERSFGALYRFVAFLDAKAMEEGRNITLPFVRGALLNYE